MRTPIRRVQHDVLPLGPDVELVINEGALLVSQKYQSLLQLSMNLLWSQAADLEVIGSRCPASGSSMACRVFPSFSWSADDRAFCHSSVSSGVV
jgi:hypothetical protein